MSGANKGWWTPAREQILREQYPLIGTAVSKILGNTPKACECRASLLGVKWKGSKPRVKRPPKPEKRSARSSYGYIPGGPVASVFDLGSRA